MLTISITLRATRGGATTTKFALASPHVPKVALEAGVTAVEGFDRREIDGDAVSAHNGASFCLQTLGVRDVDVTAQQVVAGWGFGEARPWAGPPAVGPIRRRWKKTNHRRVHRDRGAGFDGVHQWTQFESFPCFTDGVERVERRTTPISAGSPR